jgi:hypothetical protein
MPDLSDAFDRLLVSYLPSALVLTAFVTTIASIHAHPDLPFVGIRLTMTVSLQHPNTKHKA